MQTISFLLFRLQESGLGSQDILSEKAWKFVFLCVNHPFQPKKILFQIILKVGYKSSET